MREHIESALGRRTARADALVPHVAVVSPGRRDFLRSVGVGGGLAVALHLLPASVARAYSPYPTGGASMENGVVTDPAVFVAIAPDGGVTLVAHRSEMGTGTRTSVPLVIAEELEADWDRVSVVQAEGDEPKYGNQDTDGSRSLRHHVQPARQIGASVRHMLEAAAAERWGVPPERVRARDHAVRMLDGEGPDARESGQRLGYGELAEAAMAQPVPPLEALRFKSDAEFRYLGRGETPIVDLHDITTGRAVYGADVTLPGMKYAVVARPAVVGGKVASFDDTAALQVPGVERVLELPHSMPPAGFAPLGGIAVVADSTWAAIRGRDALEIEWEDGPHADYDSGAFEAAMRETASRPGQVRRRRGDPEAAFADAARVIEAEYYQPHIVHAPMEPPVAVADHGGDTLELWAPVQSPWGTRKDLAKALGLDVEAVKVNVTLLGGGFGRKSKCDFAIEAALVS